MWQWIKEDIKKLNNHGKFLLWFIVFSFGANLCNVLSYPNIVSGVLTAMVLVMLWSLFWRILLRTYRFQSTTFISMFLPMGTFKRYRDFKQRQFAAITLIKSLNRQTLNESMLDAARIDDLENLAKVYKGAFGE